MQKTTLYNISRYLIALLCFIFLIYKILQIDNYNIILLQFRVLSLKSYWLVVLAVAIMPINIILESLKWKIAIKNITCISTLNSIKSVLWGYTGAFITPNSIGEFPTRALNLPLEQRSSAIAMGFVGSIIQTIIVTLCGVTGLFFVFKQVANTIVLKSFFLLTCLVLVILFIFIFKIKKIANLIHSKKIRWINKIANILKSTTKEQLLKLFFLSFIKYTLFSIQFLLVLIVFSVSIPFSNALIEMPIFYLFLTYIPLINIFEFTVRGSVAILIFEKYTDNTLFIIAASTFFWLLNFGLPTFIGLIFGKQDKLKFQF